MQSLGRFLILGLLLATTLAGAAEAEFRIPKEVDLAAQFGAVTPMQSGFGGTCHVFAAVALVEAACFRKIGVHLDLSEGYFINRHLRSQLERSDCYALETPASSGSLTNFDGGHAKDTVARILRREVCTEKEFSTDKADSTAVKNAVAVGKKEFDRRLCFKADGDAQERFRTALQGNDKIERRLALLNRELKGINDWLKDGYGSLGFVGKLMVNDEYGKMVERKWSVIIPEIEKLQNSVKSETTTALKDLLDAQVKQKLPAGSLPSHDANLNRCLDQGLKAEVMPYSENAALKLLAEGIPFLCSGDYKLSNNAEGSHVAVRMGYRYHADTQKFEWEHRDSNRPAPTWGWSGDCEEMLIIR